MNDKTIIPSIYGSVTFKSELTLEEMSELISSIFFMGNKFSGLEKRIYNEVPAVMLNGNFIGLNVILSGGGEYDFSVGVHGNYKPKGIKNERVQLDEYLYFLFYDKLLEFENIEVIKPKSLENLNEPV